MMTSPTSRARTSIAPLSLTNAPAGPGEIHNLADSLNWLAQNHNLDVANDAAHYFTTHPWQGDFAIWGTYGVYHQRIISKEKPTVVGVKVWMDKSDQCKGALAVLADKNASVAEKIVATLASGDCIFDVTRREPLKGDGDGTVSYHGALGNFLTADDHIFVMKGVKHLDIANNTQVHNLLRNMLQGLVCTQREAPGFLSQSETEKLPGDFSQVSSAQTIAAADLWWLNLRGPAQLDIRDAQGRMRDQQSA